MPIYNVLTYWVRSAPFAAGEEKFSGNQPLK